MKIRVCGVDINAYDSRREFVHAVSEYKGLLVAVNAEKLINSSENFKSLINRYHGYADGMGAVFAMKRKGYSSVKLPGAELWLDIIEHNVNKKSIYLVGSSESTIHETVIKLKKRYPEINIIGFRNGFLSSEARNELKKHVLKTKPDLVFVAQGSPRQEQLMEELYELHSALYMGLGGSFDLFTGKAKPVPNWWKKYLKWEGLYRAFNDFGNIGRWKRQPVVFKLIYRIIKNEL